MAGIDEPALRDMRDKFIERVVEGRISEQAHFDALKNSIGARLTAKLQDKGKVKAAAQTIVDGIREMLFISGMKVYLVDLAEVGEGAVSVIDYNAMADERGVLKPEFQRVLGALAGSANGRLVVMTPPGTKTEPIQGIPFVEADSLEGLAAKLSGKKIVNVVLSSKNEERALAFAKQAAEKQQGITTTVVEPKDTGLGAIYLTFASTRLSNGKPYLLVNVSPALKIRFEAQHPDLVTYIKRVWQFLTDVLRSSTYAAISA